MFLRKKKNNSGSVSIQIISKSRGKYKVIKTISSGKGWQKRVGELFQSNKIDQQALKDLDKARNIMNLLGTIKNK